MPYELINGSILSEEDRTVIDGMVQPLTEMAMKLTVLMRFLSLKSDDLREGFAESFVASFLSAYEAAGGNTKEFLTNLLKVEGEYQVEHGAFGEFSEPVETV